MPAQKDSESRRESLCRERYCSFDWYVFGTGSLPASDICRGRVHGSVNSSSVKLASGIDSGDYRRRRVPLHCFNCPALRLDGYGRPGTCEPHPSPPSQVNSRNHVPVHYYSTLTAPELASQSLVRLESLPASRTRHTGTSCLTPRQTDNL